MTINTENLVSITEANPKFSRVARMAGEKGPVVILKNNTPCYVLVELSQIADEKVSPDEDVLAVSKRLQAPAGQEPQGI